MLRNRALKKLAGKVELNFLSSEIAVCYSPEAKYSGYRKLNISSRVDFLGDGVTLPCAHMHMRNTSFC